VPGGSRGGFQQIMAGTATAAIGEIIEDENFKIYGLRDALVVSAKIWDLKEAWQKAFRW